MTTRLQTRSAAPLFFFVSAAIALPLVLESPVGALEVEITDGSNTITIVDDGTGDLNLADPKVIDFDLTSDPTIPDLDGGGRVKQTQTALGQVLTLSATPPNLATTLKNVGAGALAITVTIRSDDPYLATIGAPLGWRLFYNGEVADPTPGDANVTGHTASLFIDNALTPLVSAVVPDINLLGDPPIDFDVSPSPGSDLVESATSSQIVATFTLGAADELRLPVNPDTDANGLQGAVFNHDGKCIFLMNKDAAAVARAEQRGDARCVRDLPSSGGDATACVDGLDAGGETAEAKLQSQFADFQCDPAPAWGLNAGTCCNGGAIDGAPCADTPECGAGGTCLAGACIGGAAQTAVNDLTHDLFGSSVVMAADNVGKCQEKILIQAAQAIGPAWLNLSQCKKKSFNSIANDTDLAAVCFNPLATAPSGRFAKLESKLVTQATRCETTGVTPVGPSFPGLCSAATTPADFGACVTDRARCRFCQGVQVADEIDPGVIDCDTFDDGVANSSCSNFSGPTTTTTTTTTTPTTTTTL